jgi:diguanylate cyclase (GGDEF)-like protein
MNNRKSAHTKNLFFFVFLLVFWGMAALYLFISFTPNFSLIGTALLIFLIIMALTNLFPFAPWVSFIFSALLFSGLVYSLLNNTREVLITSGIGVGIYLVTVLFTTLFNRQVKKLRERQEHLQQVIDSLVIYDRNTSLMRWKFAQQALTTEIHRGRRYNTKLSLILFEIWQKSQVPSEDLERIHQQMAEIIQETIREDIDIPFIGRQIGLILPETGLSGSEVLVGRLIQKFNRRVDARISAGIASFPEDAVTDEQIMDRADQALKKAMTAGREIVAYNLLKEGEGSLTAAGETQEQKSEAAAETGAEHGEQKEIRETVVPSDASGMVPEKKVEENKQSSTRPIEIQAESQKSQDTIQILKNINLDEDEWVIWVHGFNQMADLASLEKKLLGIEHVQEIEFLFLQANYLVLRLKTSLADLTQAKKPFPGWKIQKLNPDNHYLILSSE